MSFVLVNRIACGFLNCLSLLEQQLFFSDCMRFVLGFFLYWCLFRLLMLVEKGLKGFGNVLERLDMLGGSSCQRMRE